MMTQFPVQAVSISPFKVTSEKQPKAPFVAGGDPFESSQRNGAFFGSFFADYQQARMAKAEQRIATNFRPPNQQRPLLTASRKKA